MKRAITVAALFLCAAFAVQAQTLTQADRDKAMQYLESTKQGVIAATEGLSPAQWNFKSAPDRWSIAEVMEHIAAGEDMIRSGAEGALKGPARDAADDVKAIDAMVLSAMPDRSHKAQAPEPLKPNNRFGSPEGSLKHFLEARQVTEDFLKQHDDLRAHAIDSPFGKKLDGYEWILMTAGHSERHTKQILEVKADPNFPKK